MWSFSWPLYPKAHCQVTPMGLFLGCVLALLADSCCFWEVAMVLLGGRKLREVNKGYVLGSVKIPYIFL